MNIPKSISSQVKRSAYFYILALSFFIYLPLKAIRPSVINFSPKIYNGANKNWSIDADENGIIYVGNDKGLIEFDGVNWNLSKLPSKGIVRSVGVANTHAIYTGGTEEFGKWERDLSGKLRYTSLSAKINFKEIQNSDFWRTFVTKEGVYFQSFSAIFFYDYKTVRKLKSVVAPLLLLNRVRDELIYQKMKNCIYVLKGGKISKFPGSDIFVNTDVRVILPYGKNGYLFATNSKGLIVHENGQYHDLNPKLSSLLNTKEVNTGVLTRRGTYILGTLLDGLYEIDLKGNIIGHFSSENVLQNKSVLSMWQDSRNNLWLGLDKGISYVSYNENLSYFTNAIDNIGAIYAACFWNNYLLIGTNQGVFSIPRSELNGYSSPSNFQIIRGSEGQVWNLKAIDGTLYCCHNNGLFTIGEDLSVRKSPDVGTGVYNIYKERFGNSSYLVVSTYLSLKFIDQQTQKAITPKGINEPIYDVKTDHLGNLWLEHPNRGIYRCQWHPGDDSFSSIHYYGRSTSHSLPNKLQLFKVGGRINMIGDERVFQYNDIADKVEPNKVLDKLFSGIGPIRKVFSCSGNQYLALAESSFYLFSYDGYKASILGGYAIGHNLSFVDNYETIIPLNDSINLLALDDGFILYQIPNNINSTPQAGFKVDAPVVQSFKSISREKDIEYNAIDKGNISIKNTYNTIEIDFVTKNAFADYVSSQYMLEGVDIDWSPKSYSNKVSYERLPEGKYTFKIRAVDIRGNFSDITLLRFRVRPPWYNSFWAYLLYAILITGALYVGRMIIFYRFKKQHLRKIRKLETLRLKMLADELQNQVNQKNAELVTQTSFIIQKNELIEKIKALIEDFYAKNKSALLQQLIYKINNLVSHNLDTEDDWRNFLIKFEEKHTEFFKKLKANYPTLTSTDLRLCACLKLNMETKDIASLMNLSVRAVENNRYRLRKKLDLRTEQNLNEFFISIE
ncbi:MAG: hypothetical protein H6Q14_2736 [Bacteroidetes bacterium]|nr:hypothetical protein [Bacteroidota bacterium]